MSRHNATGTENSMEKIVKLNGTDRFIVASHFSDGNPMAAARFVQSRLGVGMIDADAIAEKIGQQEGVL